ncbi:MAG: type II secretion system protein GspD [Hyphomonadaceae bacterium]|nr:type II secretion system protein GspD [Hyphomonadaceae bacterium]
MKKSVAALLAGAAMCLAAPLTASAQGDHIITMQGANIRAFIDDVSKVTGRTFLVDPRVRGEVTISSEQGLSPEEVFDVFANVMRVHGYTVIPTPTGEYRITLIQGAAQESPFVTGSGPEGQFATAIITLEHVDAAEAAKLIKPAMHAQGVLTGNPGGRIIVVSDFPENLRKAREIVAAMDVRKAVIEVVRLENLDPAEVEGAIRSLAGSRPPYRIAAVPGTKNLMLEGEPAELERVRKVIVQIDAQGVMQRGPVTIVPLRHSNGENLIGLLNTLLPNYEREGEPAPTVAHEPGSNTIVISATPETQRALEQTIRQIDVRRPQVLVEAIIVEVSDMAARDLGVQFALSGAQGSSVPFIGTNFTGQGRPNLLALTGAVVGSQGTAGDSGGENGTAGRLLSGEQLGELRTQAINSLTGTRGIGIGGVGRQGDVVFGAIVNALESDTDSNVLSTPFVTTLDNVPASFLVGQDIPIRTGSSLGSANQNPFQTFERREVGIKLEVLPQISTDDVIRLEIKQEVSSLNTTASAGFNDTITNQRTIEATVLVDDGEIIVLGGLIQDDEEITVDRVPVLGDVPLIGNLFKSENKSRDKTNLMVFLRPTIIRDKDDAMHLTQDRLDQMRQHDMLQSGRDYSKIDTLVKP